MPLLQSPSSNNTFFAVIVNTDPVAAAAAPAKQEEEDKSHSVEKEREEGAKKFMGEKRTDRVASRAAAAPYCSELHPPVVAVKKSPCGGCI